MIFKQICAQSAANQYDTSVIPEQANAQILLKRLTSLAGNGSDILYWMPVTQLGETKVKTAITAATTIATLVGDAAVKNILNGITITTNDYLLLETNRNYQMCKIATINAGGADAAITITSCTPLDGTVGWTYASAAGNKAYIIFAGDIVQLAIGGISTTVAQTYENYGCGELGYPAVVMMYGAAAALHYAHGVAEYLPVNAVPVWAV
jgi:hypothetical protein